MRQSSPEMQQLPPFTPVVKKIIIASAVIWLVGQVILDQYVFKGFLETWFSFTPNLAIRNFCVWQPFTYMFFHTPDPISFLFSMLALWWVGGELEKLWGSKMFFLYYIASGAGAAFLYGLILLIYGIITGNIDPLRYPIIGSTAAIFALLLAYGLVFGDRIVYFMFLFPLKARWFVAVLAGIQIVVMLNGGLGGARIGQVAHILGIVSGYLFLLIWSQKRRGGGSSGGKKKKPENKGRLKLVVNNDEFNVEKKPKYWN